MQNPTNDALASPAWSPYDVWRTQILEPRKRRAVLLRDQSPAKSQRRSWRMRMHVLSADAGIHLPRD